MLLVEMRSYQWVLKRVRVGYTRRKNLVRLKCCLHRFDVNRALDAQECSLRQLHSVYRSYGIQRMVFRKSTSTLMQPKNTSRMVLLERTHKRAQSVYNIDRPFEKVSLVLPNVIRILIDL